mgnify:CR=1 FL=1
MLKTIEIKNYLLIESIKVDFDNNITDKKENFQTEAIEKDLVIETKTDDVFKKELDLEINKIEDEKIIEEKSENLVKKVGLYKPKLDLKKFIFPSVELLKNYGNGSITINEDELEKNKNNIVNTLKNYKIEISKIKANIGPTVTLYEIVPEAGVRISKIKNLEDDIALSLSALGIRIIAPIPGKGTIGIEVPNQNPSIVSMRSVILSEKFIKSKMDLSLIHI